MSSKLQKCIQVSSQPFSYHCTHSSKFQVRSTREWCSGVKWAEHWGAPPSCHDVTSEPMRFACTVAGSFRFSGSSVTRSWQGAREIESTDPERRPDHGVAGDCAASMCLPCQCRRRGQAGCHAGSQSVSVVPGWLFVLIASNFIHCSHLKFLQPTCCVFWFLLQTWIDRHTEKKITSFDETVFIMTVKCLWMQRVE
jgi:hypothetical protein